MNCVFIHRNGAKNAKVKSCGEINIGRKIFKLLLSFEKLSYGLNRVKTYEFAQFQKKHLQDVIDDYNLN